MARQNIIYQPHSVSMAQRAIYVAGKENATLRNHFKARPAFLEHMHRYYLLVNVDFMQAWVNKLHGRIIRGF